MSFNTFVKTKSPSLKRIPFCKECYNHKRPDYNTHYMYETTCDLRKITCPYILRESDKCSYCRCFGHIYSECKILKTNPEQYNNYMHKICTWCMARGHTKSDCGILNN